MSIAHYIIFHPDNKRDRIAVKATVLKDNLLYKDWEGEIFVDQVNNGNEDPFVFAEPWLYSYCHATQLKRDFKNTTYIQEGSMLIFCSGDFANHQQLTIDTIFVVKNSLRWDKPLGLPTKYKHLHDDVNSPMWQRHLRYPFKGSHITVSYTYEASLWTSDNKNYSFLPLDINGNRITIPFTSLPQEIDKKINKKVKGKYPVQLEQGDISVLLELVEKVTTTKVIKDINSKTSVLSNSSIASCNIC